MQFNVWYQRQLPDIMTRNIKRLLHNDTTVFSLHSPALLLSPSLRLSHSSPSSRNLNTIRCVFEEKFCQITSPEFSFRGATCEISQPQTSVGGHYSVQFKLWYATFNAHFLKMYSKKCVNMCVTFWDLCMCIFSWLLICICVCVGLTTVCVAVFVGAMTATWTSELFIIFIWRHHREPKIKLFIPLRHHTLLHPLHFNLMWTHW